MLACWPLDGKAQIITVDVKKMRGDAFHFRWVLGLIQQELTLHAAKDPTESLRQQLTPEEKHKFDEDMSA